MKRTVKASLVTMIAVSLVIGLTGCEMLGGLFGGGSASKESETEKAPDEPVNLRPPPTPPPSSEPILTPVSQPAGPSPHDLAMRAVRESGEREAAARRASDARHRKLQADLARQKQMNARFRRVLEKQKAQAAKAKASRERAEAKKKKKEAEESSAIRMREAKASETYRKHGTTVPRRAQESYRSKLRRHNAGLGVSEAAYRAAYDRLRAVMMGGRPNMGHARSAYSNYHEKVRAFRKARQRTGKSGTDASVKAATGQAGEAASGKADSDGAKDEKASTD